MLAMLHTSPVHVPVFEALRDEHAPGLELRHEVRADLLDAARAGVDGGVARAVRALGPAVLCTCSSIGPAAEAAGALRLDRAMMAAAVAHGGPITVLATVASTLAPSLALLAEEGGEAAATHVVEDAWARFEAGDRDGYLGLIAAAITAADGPGAIVLAQASMADAAGRAGVTEARVLSSPEPGFLAALARLDAAAPPRSTGR
ncbi:hypothetical protein Afil01_42150 [Actinorhabdospora filicis]|uniref:Arylsulfatase n=1 Tax=Actinorhabdospora filicis TaxID=1785913 RepID=A0A9W6SNV2_9ACTN|nr:hypothetical protein [Actinorhabdospora filicis]GLZ79408.1 hypothetical protein Afil01_42150 [Actinorhabdospora filicis]